MFKKLSKTLSKKNTVKDIKKQKSLKVINAEDVRNRNKTMIKKQSNPYFQDNSKTIERKGIVYAFKGKKDGVQEDDLKSSSKGIKEFISKSIYNLSHITESSTEKISAQLKVVQGIIRDNVEINKDSLSVQKESLEEQKEAEYKKEHRYKQSLKNAAGKMKEKAVGAINDVSGKVKDLASNPKGLMATLGKLFMAGYLLKKFWPLIKDKLLPFLKDKVFPVIKDNIGKIISSIGIGAMIMKPIGTLKLAIKSLAAVSKLIAKGASKLISVASKPLLNVVKKAATSVGDLALSGAKSVGKGVKTKVKAIGGAAKGMAVTVAAAVKEQLAPLTKKLGGFASKMIDKFPAMGKAVSGISGALKMIKPLARVIPFLGMALMAYDVIDTLFPELFGKIGNFINEFAPKVWDFVKTGFGKLGEWISSKWDNLTELVAPIWENIKEGLGKATKWLMLDNVTSWINEKFKPVMDVIEPAWNTLTEWVSKAAGWYVDIIKAEFDIVKKGWSSITGFIGNMGSWFSENMKDISSLGATIWSNVVSGISKLGTYVADKFSDSKNIAEFGSSMWKDIKNKFGTISDWIIEKFDTLTGVIENKIWDKSPDVASIIFGSKKTLTDDDNKKLLTSASSSDSSKVIDAVDNIGYIDKPLLYGNSVIADRKNFKKLPKPVIESLINSGNFSKEDVKFMQNIIKQKKEEVENLQNTELSKVTNDAPLKLNNANNENKFAIDEKLGVAAFANGGFTGKGKDDEIAGVVHKNEYVLTSNDIDELNASPKEGIGKKKKKEGLNKEKEKLGNLFKKEKLDDKNNKDVFGELSSLFDTNGSNKMDKELSSTFSMINSSVNSMLNEFGLGSNLKGESEKKTNDFGSLFMNQKGNTMNFPSISANGLEIKNFEKTANSLKNKLGKGIDSDDVQIKSKRDNKNQEIGLDAKKLVAHLSSKKDISSKKETPTVINNITNSTLAPEPEITLSSTKADRVDMEMIGVLF